MAKNQTTTESSAAPKTQEQTATGTALATAPATGIALPHFDELAGIADDMTFETDGLDDIDASDFKLPVKVWNFKGTDPAGDPIAPNVFFDTVDEVGKKTLHLTLLTLKKTNEWREYDEAEGKSKIRCKSNDQVNGVKDDGTKRLCKGCPDAEWKTAKGGKRTRNCGPVFNVGAIEDGYRPTVLRFKRSSLPTIQQHLQRHHLGRRVLHGKPSNYPLFSFAVEASLRMSDDKKYAIPVLTKTRVLTAAEIQAAAVNAREMRTLMDTFADKLAERDSSSDSGDDEEGKPDTSFNPNDFVDADGTTVAAQPSKW